MQFGPWIGKLMHEFAEERATESELAEVAAKASLQFKTDDVERVCAANVELRTESLEVANLLSFLFFG